MRRLLAVLAVGLLFATAGCTGLFGDGGVSDEQLDRAPPEDDYEWNSTTDVRIVVHDSAYTAVYDLDGTEELRLFSRGFTSERPLSIRALRYRYPNGSVVTGSSDAVEVSTDDGRRVVTVPNDTGEVAFTTGSGGKELAVPGYVEGSYEVVLPPNTRTGAFLFGDVSPGGYETQIDDDGRLHITWDEVDDGVLVRYYLQRDVLIFRGLLVAVGVGGGGGLLVLYGQIRRLRKQREELGLDVEDDDFGGGGPPPGMR